MADKQTKSRELTGENTALRVALNVDVSEALTGLKAVQREARKAAQALRELEETCAKAGRLDLLKAFNGGGTADE